MYSFVWSWEVCSEQVTRKDADTQSEQARGITECGGLTAGQCSLSHKDGFTSQSWVSRGTFAAWVLVKAELWFMCMSRKFCFEFIKSTNTYRAPTVCQIVIQMLELKNSCPHGAYILFIFLCCIYDLCFLECHLPCHPFKVISTLGRCKISANIPKLPCVDNFMGWASECEMECSCFRGKKALIYFILFFKIMFQESDSSVLSHLSAGAGAVPGWVLWEPGRRPEHHR